MVKRKLLVPNAEYRVGMENLFLRLSFSFACVSVELNGKRKRETVFAHIVGGVHF